MHMVLLGWKCHREGHLHGWGQQTGVCGIGMVRGDGEFTPRRKVSFVGKVRKRYKRDESIYRIGCECEPPLTWGYGPDT